MKLSRLEILGGASTALATLQIILDGGSIGNTTLILLAVGAASFVLPEILSEEGGLRNLRKIKFGKFEAEFEERIREAEESIIRAEKNEHEPKPRFQGNIPPLENSYVEEYERVISSPASSREKIILGGLLVERMAAETARNLEIEMTGLHTARDFVRALKKNGFLSDNEADAFDSFWKVRNLAVHSSKDNLTDEQTLRLLDLLWRLVKVFG